MVGIGVCAVIGIGLALLLIVASTPLNWPHRVAFCWAGSSAECLGITVALPPLVAYESARTRHVNPDEES